jgi:hypothetical protein
MLAVPSQPHELSRPRPATAEQAVPRGSYVGPDGPGALKGHPKVGTPSRAARDVDTARRLWGITAGLTGVDGPSGIH